MMFSDAILVFQFADSSELAIGQEWLAELETKDRMVRALKKLDARSTSRGMRRALVQGRA